MTEQIRKRLEAATPGPWQVVIGVPITAYQIRAHQGPIEVQPASVYSEPDATFIAHTPTDIAYLLDALALSQAREGELREALKPFAGLPETSEAETAVPNNSPVTIRCELGDVRRARSALSPPKEKT